MLYKTKTTTNMSELIANIRIVRQYGLIPEGWNRVEMDLNDNAGGDYLYLVYRMANENDTRVIDFIGVHNTGGTSSPTHTLPINDGYWTWARAWDNENVIVDLNQGAEGDYIWLSLHYADIP
jgi:hypothetical protein